ncbi:uncharacterized protein [Callorhinus ursinus]|uniref:uncharacterized protein n=1 Tax=Callorhinus ursinus TaxID=34884 RepID=UPI003CD02EF8
MVGAGHRARVTPSSGQGARRPPSTPGRGAARRRARGPRAEAGRPRPGEGRGGEGGGGGGRAGEKEGGTRRLLWRSRLPRSTSLRPAAPQPGRAEQLAPCAPPPSRTYSQRPPPQPASRQPHPSRASSPSPPQSPSSPPPQAPAPPRGRPSRTRQRPPAIGPVRSTWGTNCPRPLCATKRPAQGTARVTPGSGPRAGGEGRAGWERPWPRSSWGWRARLSLPPSSVDSASPRVRLPRGLESGRLPRASQRVPAGPGSECLTANCQEGPEWPMHLERVGVDRHVSASRGFLRGRAGRNAWNAGLGPRVSLRKAAGCAGRGASKTPSVLGSRAQGRPGSDAGPKVVRAGGEGALWPATAASSLQRWPWCCPRPLMGGGCPSPGPTYLFPRRFNLGKKENYAAAL